MPESEGKLVVLQRIDTRKGGTLGRIRIDGKHICYTVERPWQGNEPSVSCVPAGRYDLVWKQSPRFGLKLHLNAVQGRTHILIHAGNTQADTKGCILPVTSAEYIDAIGQCGGNSRKALARLEANLPKRVAHQISIRDCVGYDEDR